MAEGAALLAVVAMAHELGANRLPQHGLAVTVWRRTWSLHGSNVMVRSGSCALMAELPCSMALVAAMVPPRGQLEVLEG
ncbi:hypothetical protein TanjilG_10062 [Lupinus angustifolius]|uniref:Uncharacterized protein n=1 Tax=Lupinus angustifolius TaxID=3871 RepID=A0A1J7FZG4_LUPAN|nr:hypothetical protein TanjilG_10062 [Lupinus angustifolius]